MDSYFRQHNQSDLNNKLVYTLLPGEVFVTRKNMVINTILGSCVAVCLWDKKRKIGGMNHVMIPICRAGEPISTRFANVGTFVLYDMLQKEGVSPQTLSARVFGGANSMWYKNKEMNVGSRNIEITLSTLKKLNIPIIGQNLGGTIGQKIYFDVFTGKIKMFPLTNYNFKQENMILTKDSRNEIKKH